MPHKKVNKYLTGRDVREVADERFDYLYSEFENVYVAISGGKDSTVILNMAIEAAERAGRLPVNAHWLDQEAEWLSVVAYMRRIKADPRVDLRWYQFPTKLSNSGDEKDPFLWCWRDGDRWMRELETDTIKENPTPKIRFHETLDAIPVALAGEARERSVVVGGMRCEESPQRRHAYTSFANHKWMTWFKKPRRWQLLTATPIYDWSYRDVWKAIHDGGWDYCEIYDRMYRHGMSLQKMRVSSLIHEYSLAAGVNYIHELEPETWNALQSRMSGINAARHLDLSHLVPEHLPRAFSSWPEYVDYLVEELVEVDEDKAVYRKRFALNSLTQYLGTPWEEQAYRTAAKAVIRNDIEFKVYGAGLTSLREWIKISNTKDLVPYNRRRYVRVDTNGA